VPIASSNVTRTNAEGWVKPPERMRALFSEHPELCDRSLELA
jgi:DNA polymerase III alpha subunit